jgi:hypothetical protein
LLGCDNGYSKGWSWGVVAEDGKMTTQKFLWDRHEIRVDDIVLVDNHKKCKDGHYIDPYTKNEYCLPEDLGNIGQLHFYLVKK